MQSHGTAIFLPWHRLYVAMLEQALMHHMLQIAKEFEKVGNALYMEKVGKFRFPYWEPCRPRSVVKGTLSYGLPKVLSLAKVLIWRPVKDSEGRDIIRNPLYQYQFPTREVMKNFLEPTANAMRNPSANADDLCTAFFGALATSTPEVCQSMWARTRTTSLTSLLSVYRISADSDTASKYRSQTYRSLPANIRS